VPKREATIPQRPRLTAQELTVDLQTQQAFGRTGVLRDVNGLPIYDSAPEMAPVYARGLFADHGLLHEMSRGDPAIAGTMDGLRKTIGRGTYTIQALPNETSAEQEFRELASDFLGVNHDLGQPPKHWDGMLEGGLTRHLYQAAGSKVYGFSAFEITTKTVEWRGRLVVVPYRLRAIAPWSIARWLWVGDTLVGLTQVTQQTPDYQGCFGVQSSLGYSLGGGWRYIDIPASRLIIYTNQHADGNPEGTSDLRSCWIHWKAKKETIIRHEGAEEMLFKGYAKITESEAPNGGKFSHYTENEIKELEDIADDLVEGLTKRFRPPAGLDIEIHHPEYQIPVPVQMLHYYDQQIFLALQMILLGLSSSHAGSASMSAEASDMMVTNLEGSAEEQLDVFNGLPGVLTTGVLARLAAWNFPASTLPRRARLSVLGFSNARSFADYLQKLGMSRWVTPTARDEQVARHRGRLPVLTLEEIQAERELMKGEPTQATQKGTQA